MSQFEDFPKMARWSRDVIVTEKIDGTNAQILITDDGEFFTGSRTRWITPEMDNHGFSAWAHKHREELMQLGPGRHFGEWWGSGIQRGYGLTEKRFSLFNAARWCMAGMPPEQIPNADPRIVKFQDVLPACVGTVPVLYRGPMDGLDVDALIQGLRDNGSRAAHGFMKPEGLIVFHVAAGVGFKKTLEKDGLPKSIAYAHAA